MAFDRESCIHNARAVITRSLLCNLRNDADVERLDKRMVSAFESALLLLPRPPSNSHYDDFLNESREYSYKSPFYAPTPPPHLNITIPVSRADWVLGGNLILLHKNSIEIILSGIVILLTLLTIRLHGCSTYV